MEPVKPIPPKGTPTQITINAGETLSALAVRYNTSVNSIMKANGLKNPNNINEGDVITVNVVTDAEMKSYKDLLNIYEKQVAEINHAKEVARKTEKAEALIEKAKADGYSNKYNFSINKDGNILIKLKSEQYLKDIREDFSLPDGELINSNPSIKNEYEMGKGIRKSDGSTYDTWDGTLMNKNKTLVIDTDKLHTSKSLLLPAKEAAKKGRLW